MTLLRDLAHWAQLGLEFVVGVFGLRRYEEPRYDVLETLPSGVEMRRYAPRVAVQVDVAGSGVDARDEAFRILFRYIAGANAAAARLATTAPVSAATEPEKIAMTVPVATTDGEGGVRMQFFLPARYTVATAPRPADERVRIVPVAEETVAVMRISGSAPRQEIARRTAALLAGMAAADRRPAGTPVVLYYDAPFTVPFLRRNEVAVAVSPG